MEKMVFGHVLVMKHQLSLFIHRVVHLLSSEYLLFFQYPIYANLNCLPSLYLGSRVPNPKLHPWSQKPRQTWLWKPLLLIGFWACLYPCQFQFWCLGLQLWFYVWNHWYPLDLHHHLQYHIRLWGKVKERLRICFWRILKIHNCFKRPCQ